MTSRATTAIAIAWLFLLPVFSSTAAAQSASSSSGAKTTKSAATHATRGVIKSVNDTSLVISRSARSGGDMTFVLDPSTERVGTMDVGSTVDVRYRTEAKHHLATAVTVVHAKAPAPSPSATK
jgi:hypothetical protein